MKKRRAGIFSVDDLADVGTDEGTPVTNYGGLPHFKGHLEKVTIETYKQRLAATNTQK